MKWSVYGVGTKPATRNAPRCSGAGSANSSAARRGGDRAARAAARDRRDEVGDDRDRAAAVPLRRPDDGVAAAARTAR